MPDHRTGYEIRGKESPVYAWNQLAENVRDIAAWKSFTVGNRKRENR
jgi:hypothetical protein